MMELSLEAQKKRDELILDETQFCVCRGSICYGCDYGIKKIYPRAFSVGYEFSKQESLAEIENFRSFIQDLEPSILPTNHRLKRQELLERKIAADDKAK